LTKGEMVRLALRHEEPPLVPTQDDFGDDNAEERLLPPDAGLSPEESAIRRAEYLGDYTIGAGGAGFRSEREDEGPDSYLLHWETGAAWRIHLRPQWWREYWRYPVQRREDLDHLELPNPADAGRYAGIGERVRYFQDAGYFVTLGVPDVFAGVWYYLRPFEEYLLDMVEEPAFAAALMERVGTYALESMRHLLPFAPDAIAFGGDMGYNQGTFMSPRTFEALLLPWYARYCEVAHAGGAFTSMHCHGNINAIMPMLSEAGVDVINPVGPGDGMDLADLKRRYGSRMTFMGGISKFIGRMSRDDLRAHLEEVYGVGSPGGGFIAYSEGSIPVDMADDDVRYYLDLKADLSYRFGRGA
jgi:uroporphyrinogen decarboxylase